MNDNTPLQFPDEAGYFDHRTVVQVFASFDVPTIYTFISKTNDLYFAYQYDEDGAKSTWLFIPTDQGKVKRLTQGAVTIREYFRISLCGYLVIMTAGKVVGSPQTLKYSEFPSEFLPAAGVKLKRNISDVVITVKKAGLNPFSTPDQLLTDLLTEFRKSIRRIMRGLKEFSDEFDSCKTSPKYALTGINWGSLELTLTPMDRNPLFDASLDTVQKVVGNPDATDVPEDLRTLVKTTLFAMAPKARGKYNFDSIMFHGTLVSESTASRNIAFALSGTETELYKRETTLNKPQKIKLTGTVRALDLDDDFFRLGSVDSNDFDINEIKCNFEQEVLESLGAAEKPWNVLMDKRVTVECEYTPRSRSVDVMSIAPA